MKNLDDLNDLGLTPAAQEQMDALCEQHDSQMMTAEIVSDLYLEHVALLEIRDRVRDKQGLRIDWGSALWMMDGDIVNEIVQASKQSAVSICERRMNEIEVILSRNGLTVQ